MLSYEYNSDGWKGVCGGARKLEMCINGAGGLAQAQTFYFASACQSRDSLLSSPGITL